MPTMPPPYWSNPTPVPTQSFEMDTFFRRLNTQMDRLEQQQQPALTYQPVAVPSLQSATNASQLNTGFSPPAAANRPQLSNSGVQCDRIQEIP